MTDEILLDVEERMENAVQAYGQTLASIRTGRASTSLVEHLLVEHYDQRMPLNQLANLGAPEAQLITVTPWDKGAVNSIMRAIQKSDLGITPQSDGSIIRLPIPPLTEERRRELVKQVHGKTEDARISVRNARRHGNDELRKVLRAGDVSEDDERRAMSEIERLTGQYIERLEALGKEKERELLEV